MASSKSSVSSMGVSSSGAGSVGSTSGAMALSLNISSTIKIVLEIPFASARVANHFFLFQDQVRIEPVAYLTIGTIAINGCAYKEPAVPSTSLVRP
jgi:hypothetical protein